MFPVAVRLVQWSNIVFGLFMIWMPTHTYLEVFGTLPIFSDITNGQHATHTAVGILLKMLKNKSMKTNSKFHQNCVHILSIHGVFNLFHLLSYISTDFDTGLQKYFFTYYTEMCRSLNDTIIQHPARCVRENVQCSRNKSDILLTCWIVLLTLVHWMRTLFSSSGLKSVFFCSAAKICFICLIIQFKVLSMPVSSFISICSIISFFFWRHSDNFGEELISGMRWSLNCLSKRWKIGAWEIAWG